MTVTRPSLAPPCIKCGTTGGTVDARKNSTRPIRTKQMCKRCYNHSRCKNTRPTEAKPCVDCGTLGGQKPRFRKLPWRAKGRCRRCYLLARRLRLKRQRQVKPCSKCKTLGGTTTPKGWPRRIHGLCSRCYQASRRPWLKYPKRAVIQARIEAERKRKLDELRGSNPRVEHRDYEIHRLRKLVAS